MLLWNFRTLHGICIKLAFVAGTRTVLVVNGTNDFFVTHFDSRTDNRRGMRQARWELPQF